MLPDAVDGMLSAEEQRVFEVHLAGCVECAREFEDAQRGAAWLGLLKSQTPEPPANLLAKILAETTGKAEAAFAAPALVAHVSESRHGAAGSVAGKGGGFGRRISAFSAKFADVFSFDNARATFQPRFAMTAAMAFFSIALTLNMTGVRLKDLRAANFTPGGMRRTVADMSASATRSFQNLRVVYQVESRVSELREDEKLGGDRQPESAGGSQRGDEPTQSAPQPQLNTAPATEGVQGGSGEQEPKPAPKPQEPKPQGTSDLVMPMRQVRGGLVARKEV
jgi:hypothetical protein